MANPSTSSWASPFYPSDHHLAAVEGEATSAAASASRHRLYCDGCGGEDFDPGDDGFFYCRGCGSQSQDLVATACADEDVVGHEGAGSGAVYNLLHHRARTAQPQTPNPTPKPTKDEILRSLAQSLAAGGTSAVKKEAEAATAEPYWFNDDGPSEPRDFAAGPCSDAEAMAGGIRLRYVQGLQVMLQLQCEALVEKFGVSPLICGLAGTVWLRYVAASRVFDEGWARRVISESEAAATSSRDGEQEGQKPSKHLRAKHRWEPHNLYGQRAIYIWFRSLRKTLPVYSILAISFLVCHIARVAVLPTDIYEWALEGKLPYLTAFKELDKYLGSPSNACPLSSRVLFRPIRVIGAWHLEAIAASIAQTISLCLPSVNFYAIAYRYLKDLCLPAEKILPHACRLYEWTIPAELWLSMSVCRLPTRVCVMSILIVTIRILYDIQGQGTWEVQFSDVGDSLSSNGRFRLNPKELNLNSASNSGEIAGDGIECQNMDSSPVKNLSCLKGSEFNTEELLSILDASYHKISTRNEFSKDLQSYLRYCNDVAFAGTATSYDEETLIERLWDIYDNKEDDNIQEDVKLESLDIKGKRPRDDVSAGTSLDFKKPKKGIKVSPHADKWRSMDECICAPAESKMNRNGFVNDFTDLEGKHPIYHLNATSSRNVAVEKLKLNMEENGFQYLPPRFQQRTDRYLHYRRKRVDGRLIYVAHADYYVLLRACAKLAQVDVRIMHIGVLKFERRLAWIEQQINSSLKSLPKIPCQTTDE